MAGGQGGRSQKRLPGFRANAQLGDELSRHTASREDCLAGALDEEGKRFGIYGMKRFVRKLNHDLAAVKERAQGELEQ